MWAPISCYLFICSTSFCFFICLDLGVSPGNKNSFDYLPALRSISTHLCFFCLCFSLSSKSSTPESPKTPSSPWDLEWMLSQLTRLFPTSHKRTGRQPSKELFGELCCSRWKGSPLCTKTQSPRWQLLSSAEPIFNVHSKKCWMMKEDRESFMAANGDAFDKGWYSSSELWNQMRTPRAKY